MSSGVNPVVPTTAWTPAAAHQARFSRAAARTVKSTATSAPAAAMASAVAGDLHAGHRGAHVVGVDGGHQFQVGVARHRLAHRGPHAATRAEHRHPRRHPPVLTVW